MENSELLAKVKKKKEFSELPDSIVLKVLNSEKLKNLSESERVKNTRAFLRKYFAVFLTNKIIKGKLNEDEILKKHISSRERNYDEVYKKILENEKCIVDLGAGVNGFSFKFIRKFSEAKYIGLEATKVLVDQTNSYFKKNNFNAEAKWGDLFNLDEVLNLIKKQEKPVAVWMFNVIDALEFLEKNFSKKLISEILNKADKIVLSFPTRSLTKKTKFRVKRNWLLNFIEENSDVTETFESNNEKFIIFRR